MTTLPVIFDLPLELIFHIIHVLSLTNEDAFNLALTCHHFHRLLIPYLLEEYGVHGNPIESGSLELTRCLRHEELHDCLPNPHAVGPSRSPDSLSVVNLAFQLPDIPKLKCTFHGGRFVPIVHQINRLKDTVSRFTVVDEAELVFGQASYHSCTVGARDSSDEDMRLWTESFGGLLNTFLEKGAKRLAVRGGMLMTKVYYRLPPVILEHRTLTQRVSTRLRSSLRQVKKNPTSLGSFNVFKPRRARPTIVPILPSLIQSQITTFELSSQIMFTTPFSQWTFCLLKASPNLKTLVLSDLALSSNTWDQYFRFLQVCLSSSGCELTSFSLLRCTGAPVLTILSFLRHHPSLVTLLLDDSHYLSPPVPNLAEVQTPFLPCVKTFQGSPAYVQHFFQIRPLLPLFESVKKRRGFPLPRIATRKPSKPLPHLNQLRICLRYSPISTAYTDDQLSHILSHIIMNGKCDELVLIFETYGSWEIATGHDVLPNCPPSSWTAVTRLVVPLKCFGFRDRLPASNVPRSASADPSTRLPQSTKDSELYQQQQTCKFINDFIGVQRISIVESPYRNGHGAIPMKRPLDSEVQYLLGELWLQCTRIQSIDFLGVIYHRP